MLIRQEAAKEILTFAAPKADLDEIIGAGDRAQHQQ
jgi:hypothetical protein